ncbi:hypothetical protein C0J50_9726, partial [Silurus asotus]
GAAGSSITPEQTIIYSPEGSNTTLTCTYDQSANRLYWYLFLIMILVSANHVTKADQLDPRLSIRQKNGKVDLEIFPAAVSDSALYYCAMEPTVTQNSYPLYKN